MAVWEHLNVDKAHIAYAVVGVFSAIFSLVSLFVKEKLYIGEATVAAIVGLIVGPHCLNWFSPVTWGNSDYITLELSRIVLCLQIFAVAVELPKKYMLKHWLSVFMLLVPVMTWGWLIVGLFVYILIPGLNFAEGLTVAACITATDPVLAAAVVGKGKFAQRVPGHLRNLLSAESGCNDGMAFPFIFLGVNLVIHAGNPGEIVKDWICVTILYECILGCLIGVAIGYAGRHSIKYAEKKGLIDRESFLSFYVVLALTCAGFGSMLGVDDLLVSFAAGAAFSWDGWFAKKTEETHVSTVIDLLLNLAYFVYFGSIIPWPQFNNHELGTDVWRLVVLAFVVLFLRRIPAVLALKPFIPDIKSWREALFCGHFGPIGVGAVFAAILTRASLEGAHTKDSTPLAVLPSKEDSNYQLIAVIWPITTFLIIASIIVHGSSVAVITLSKELQALSITKTFSTTTTGNGNSSNWISRLPDLKTGGRSFSLHRIDTTVDGVLSQSATIETTGIPAKPAGGMERRKKKEKKNKKKRLNGLRKIRSHHPDEQNEKDGFTSEQLQREKEAKAASFALGGSRVPPQSDKLPEVNEEGYTKPPKVGVTPAATFKEPTDFPTEQVASDYEEDNVDEDEGTYGVNYERSRKATNAYAEGDKLIVEDQHGEILESAQIVTDAESLQRIKSQGSSFSTTSISSPLRALQRIATQQGQPQSKYIAYKVNDTLIIENEEGEIVRRYKINHHALRPGARKPRSRGSTFSRALNAVGIKTGGGSEHRSSVTEPGVPVIEERVSDVDDSNYQDEDESEEEDEEESESEQGKEDENETEFEKVRRLTALGEVQAPRDDDDEEEQPATLAQNH